MYLIILHLVFFFQIYKSTKCNDMVQTGYCPRGPFCAFAHVERKLISFYLSGSMCEIKIKQTLIIKFSVTMNSDIDRYRFL